MLKKAIFAGLLATAVAVPVLAASSGLAKGESVTPFHPSHVAGPDKGTDTCPPCKYGARPAVQVWVNADDMKNVEAIAKSLNAAVKTNKKAEFKAFLIVLTEKEKSEKVSEKLQALAKANALNDIGIAYLDKENEAVKNYKVNCAADVKNTVFVYKNMKVQEKFVNLKADEKGLASLNEAIRHIATP